MSIIVERPYSKEPKTFNLIEFHNEKQLFVIGDGSRGPAKQLQPGIRYLAKKSNLPIIFFDCQVQHKITFHKTWDKFQLPLPFTKIFITVTKQ